MSVASPLLEILLLSKTAKIPFLSMVIKKFNRSESAQKFIQVGIDVACMYNNFGERGLSTFGDIATFKNGQISLSDNGL